MCKDKKEYIKRATMRINNNFRVMMDKEILRFIRQFPEEKGTYYNNIYFDDYIKRLFNKPKNSIFKRIIKWLRW